MIHPFVVHFAFSLALLAGATELVPAFRKRIREDVRSGLFRSAVILLLLAAATGWITFGHLESTGPSLPRAAVLHRAAGLCATGIFLALTLARKKERPTLPAMLLALSGSLFILFAAAIGGGMVYHDHLGTGFPLAGP